MVCFSKQLVMAAAVFAVVQAHPRKSFEIGGIKPASAVKRALYNLDDIPAQENKNKLTQGLRDAVKVAAKTLEKMDDDRYKPRLAFWFGDQHSDDNARETIRQVYKNFVSDNDDGTGSDVNGNVVVYGDDYWKPTDAQFPGVGADGTKPYCDLKKNGKSGAAYYKKNKKKPGMHFCDKVFDRTNLTTLLGGSCKHLGDIISTKYWTKQFIGANVLHEYMHYDKIGEDAVGEQIGDVIYDAFQCHALAIDDDVERRKKTILNADTYVWYALDIAFTELCNKGFSDPRDEGGDGDDIDLDSLSSKDKVSKPKKSKVNNPKSKKNKSKKNKAKKNKSKKNKSKKTKTVNPKPKDPKPTDSKPKTDKTKD